MDSQHLNLARQLLLQTDPRHKIWYLWVLAQALEQDYRAVSSTTLHAEPSDYEQLLSEAVKNIPTQTSGWTDHNDSDPGIALATLFSFMADFKNRVTNTRRGPVRRKLCQWLCC